MNLKEEMNEFIENQEDFYLNSKQNHNMLDMEMDISLNDKKNEQHKKLFSKSNNNANPNTNVDKPQVDYEVNKKASKKLEHFI